MATLSKTHCFDIDGMEVELLLTCKDGYYECRVIKGDTGTGWSGGGQWNNLEEYAKSREQQHRYTSNFFAGKTKYTVA